MTRDAAQDAFYLWKAHQHLQTGNEATFVKKLKSIRQPFRAQINQMQGAGNIYNEKEDGAEKYSHEKVDYKNKRIVPLPKTGGAIAKRYEEVAGKYFEQRYNHQLKGVYET